MKYLRRLLFFPLIRVEVVVRGALLVGLLAACSPSAASIRATPNQTADAPPIEQIVPVGTQQAFLVTPAQLLKTSDGGDSWVDASPPNGGGFIDASFLDSNTGWLASEAGSALSVFMTSDGGQTWKSSGVSEEFPDGLRSVQITHLDPQHVWMVVALPTSAAAAMSLVYRSSDGGASWSLATAAPEPLTGPMTFTDTQNGWAVGDAGGQSLFATSDGGSTWQRVELSFPPKWQGDHTTVTIPSFFSDQEGVLETYARGDQPTTLVFVTRDAGKTWSEAAEVPLPASYDADFPPPFNALDESHWRLNIPSGLQETSDQGSNWTLDSSDPVLANLESLLFVSDSTGWGLSSDSGCTGFKEDCWTRTTALRSTDGGHTWVAVKV